MPGMTKVAERGLRVSLVEQPRFVWGAHSLHYNGC